MLNQSQRDELNSFARLYESNFVDAMQLGFTAYSTIASGLKVQFRNRTQSSALNDFIINAAKQAFDTVVDVNWVSERGVEILQIPFRNRIIRTKFKMLNPNLRPSNIVTQSVMNFLNQPQLMLDGYEPNVNLIAGYLYNKARTAPRSTYLVCPNGPTNVWDYPLPEIQSIGAPAPQLNQAMPDSNRIRIRS